MTVIDSKLLFVFLILAQLLLAISGCQHPVGDVCGEPPPFEASRFVYCNTHDNKYREQLLNCSSPIAICPIRQLPFIGMETSQPTVANIMNRVVVSHAWMGARFEEVLNSLSPEARQVLLLMSRAVTVIVISDDIRPSLYNPWNSVIYLDPKRLALRTDEDAVIDQTPDFRSNFGDDLMVDILWRYVSSNDTYFYRLNNSDRSFIDVLRYTIRLLLHELAHANDYYPFKLISNINCNNSNSVAACDVHPYALVAQNDFSPISQNFGYQENASSAYSLSDKRMNRYASIRYLGSIFSDEERHWSAHQMANWFGNDAANHDYAYTTQSEDIAMLTEAVLLKYLFNADMDIGFSIRPHEGEQSADRQIVWGTRGRIGVPAVKRRAQRLFSEMLPDVLPAEFFDRIDPAQSMQLNCGWIDNLDLRCFVDTAMSSVFDQMQPRLSTYDLRYDIISPHD